MHLAQFNIGRMAYELDDPRMADFNRGIDMLNSIAERSDGFVWKYETAFGGVVPEEVDGDPRILVNLTVWDSVDSLRFYVWNTLHKHFVTRRADWFTPMDEAHLVMWWVPEGHRPDLAEALAKLEYLRQNGETEDAFSWNAVSKA
ncbi:DUF3291 domain-containing protein [Nioella sp.]|uniref:DUF3291 domain-containing protein n=1 Tax=Nioella sp. TaxID=1912091 RepID=UPI003B51A99C